MRVVSLISFFLTVLGAINWLLVGISRFDLVRWAFGSHSWPGRLTYSLVGAAGLTQLTTFILRAVRGRPVPEPV
jgi:uncharacterized membrane protein YuzA (DUF378 family)